LKLAADQADAAARFNSGLCLTKGEGVTIDFKRGMHDLKLAAHQQDAVAQNNDGNCPHDGTDAPKDLKLFRTLRLHSPQVTFRPLSVDRV
jgi:TPR repeat protein